MYVRDSRTSVFFGSSGAKHRCNPSMSTSVPGPFPWLGDAPTTYRHTGLTLLSYFSVPYSASTVPHHSCTYRSRHSEDAWRIFRSQLPAQSHQLYGDDVHQVWSPPITNKLILSNLRNVLLDLAGYIPKTHFPSNLKIVPYYEICIWTKTALWGMQDFREGALGCGTPETVPVGGSGTPLPGGF